jgi:hypothetical protein
LDLLLESLGDDVEVALDLGDVGRFHGDSSMEPTRNFAADSS